MLLPDNTISILTWVSLAKLIAPNQLIKHFAEGNSEPWKTSKKERFAKIVNVLTILGKYLILDFCDNWIDICNSTFELYITFVKKISFTITMLGIRIAGFDIRVNLFLEVFITFVCNAKSFTSAIIFFFFFFSTANLDGLTKIG